MSLAHELAELERQRGDEVRNLHFTYLRTKREVQRAVNPTRLVRKHLVLSLAAGALLGLLLAPRPTPRPVNEEVVDRAVRKAHRRRGVSASWFRRLLARFSPEIAQFIPDDSEQQVHEEAEQIREEAKEEGKKQQKHGKHGAIGAILWILEAALPMILGKIDWRALVNQVMHGVYEKTKRGSHNGHEPQVSVADAGAVKPADFDDFE